MIISHLVKPLFSDSSKGFFNNIMETEIWKDVVGYEGCYQVSSFGRIKGVTRNVPTWNGSRATKDIILKQIIWDGYYTACLCKDNKKKTVRVHQIMAMAFLNHKPSGYKYVVDHINNNRSDNRLENLQIITNRENSSKDKKNCSSSYVGVYLRKLKVSKWTAYISINRKKKYLGSFFCEIQASEAYQKALREHLQNG